MTIKNCKLIAFLLLLLPLVTSCERNELCYSHPHGNLYVNVVWDDVPPLIQNTLPEGMAIRFFHKDEAAGYPYANHFYRGPYGGLTNVPNGDYKLMVYNSDTERINLKGLDKHNDVCAFLSQRTRNNYLSGIVSSSNVYRIEYLDDTRANTRTRSEILIGQTDRVFTTMSQDARSTAIGGIDNAETDTIYTHPQSRVMWTKITVKANGLKGALSCAGSISGVNHTLQLHDSNTTDETGTIIFDMFQTDDTTLSQTLYIFGFEQSPAGTPRDESIQQILRLEFLMTDNKVYAYEFDVANQIDFANLKPETEVPIYITEIDLPTMTDQSGGLFDADISNWGDEIITEL